MKSKKGDWTLLQTMTIVGGIIAAVIIFSIVARISSKDKIEAMFAAKDAGLLSDAILSAPQDVALIYPKSPGYVVLNDGIISLYLLKPGPGQSSDYSQTFIPRGDIKVQPGEAEGGVFFLVKKDGYYFASTNPEYIVASVGGTEADTSGEKK